ALVCAGGTAVISVVCSGEERAVAMGTLVGVAGVAQSIGPLVGGFLTAAVSWRLIFLINLPLIALIMFIALRAIQESRDEYVSHRIYIAGRCILAVGLTSFIIVCD